VRRANGEGDDTPGQTSYFYGVANGHASVGNNGEKKDPLGATASAQPYDAGKKHR